jgi:hypothetical protein
MGLAGRSAPPLDPGAGDTVACRKSARASGGANEVAIDEAAGRDRLGWRHGGGVLAAGVGQASTDLSVVGERGSCREGRVSARRRLAPEVESALSGYGPPIGGAELWRNLWTVLWVFTACST